MLKVEKGQSLAMFRGMQDSVHAPAGADGLSLFVLYRSPASKEIRQFEDAGQVRLALFTGEGEIFFAFRAGDGQWMDAPYTPHVGLQTFASPDPEGYGFQLALVDTMDGVVKAISRGRIPADFSRRVYKVSKAVADRFFLQADYQWKIQLISSIYSSEKMAECADMTCTIACEAAQEKREKAPAVRRSLLGIAHTACRRSDLSEKLKAHAYHIPDMGNDIMAVPKTLLDEAKGKDLFDHEVPIPVNYVLEKGYAIRQGHVIVDAPYALPFGLDVDEEYYDL